MNEYNKRLLELFIEKYNNAPALEAEVIEDDIQYISDIMIDEYYRLARELNRSDNN
jgi:hypothetical protein